MVKKKKKAKTHFDLDFKKKAVLMTTKKGVTVNEVADELGVSQQNLSRWRSQFLKDDSFDMSEQRLDAVAENKKLKKEMRLLKAENEILKKAASYFASHQ